MVFGSLSWTESLLNLGELGASGLTLQGAERRQYVGHSVATAGGKCRDARVLIAQVRGVWDARTGVGRG